MATRKTSARPTPKPAPAAPLKKKAASPRKRTSAAIELEPVDEPATRTGGAEGLLRAGLKALGNVRNDVVKRQTNVIEGLLGIHKTDAPFGIRKFEDVFDQRVATALQRLGMPTAEEVQALRDEVRQLQEQLARAQPAARRKR